MCMIEISPSIETRRLTLRAPAPKWIVVGKANLVMGIAVFR